MTVDEQKAKAAREARALGMAKAGARKMNGLYRYEIDPLLSAGDYWVYGPLGQRYLVSPDEDQMLVYCSCPFFRGEGVRHACKHIVWLRQELAAEEAAILEAIASLEETMAGAEHPVWGCDPDMHFDRAAY